jgi:hypothetical protein
MEPNIQIAPEVKKTEKVVPFEFPLDGQPEQPVHPPA